MVEQTGYEAWDRLLGGIAAGLVVIRGPGPATLPFACIVASHVARRHDSPVLVLGFGTVGVEPGGARILLERAQVPEGSAYLFTGEEDDVDAMVYEIAELGARIVLVDSAIDMHHALTRAGVGRLTRAAESAGATPARLRWMGLGAAVCVRVA